MNNQLGRSPPRVALEDRYTVPERVKLLETHMIALDERVRKIEVYNPNSVEWQVRNSRGVVDRPPSEADTERTMVRAAIALLIFGFCAGLLSSWVWGW